MGPLSAQPSAAVVLQQRNSTVDLFQPSYMRNNVSEHELRADGLESGRGRPLGLPSSSAAAVRGQLGGASSREPVLLTAQSSKDQPAYSAEVQQPSAEAAPIPRLSITGVCGIMAYDAYARTRHSLQLCRVQSCLSEL